uniref:Uncharacterized protein n=1 Tax=Arundo donax TaxID=35708 RepID=A0A0A9F4J2_ARUDO
MGWTRSKQFPGNVLKQRRVLKERMAAQKMTRSSYAHVIQ